MADTPAFDRSVLDRALARLGELVTTDIRIVLAGGSALMYLPDFTRGTNDGDVIVATPKLSTISREILVVADEMRLPQTWLNDGAKAWAGLLPHDYESRTERVGHHGRLVVDRLGRQDLILLKLAGTRPKDQDDLRDLAPTSGEIAFVRAHLDGVNRVNPTAALRIELYLEQYGGGDARLNPAPPSPRGRKR
jgi:hypothetical protein